MKTIAVTGASGLVGTVFCELARANGHRVFGLARVAAPSAQTPGWNIKSGQFVLPDNARADVVVHLAGETVVGRWTPQKKRAILDSRVPATRALATFLAQQSTPPEVFVSASAIGIYGNRGDAPLDETAMAGTGFLARVATEWEDATLPAKAAGIRVVTPRLGIVLSTQGGALAAMRPPFALGLGGPMGKGTQWMSWISLEDTARALLHVVETREIAGPLNFVAPEPVRNREFAQTLAAQLRRPALLPVPGFVLRLLLGEAADGMLLYSSRVVPAHLENSGFQWNSPNLAEALKKELA
ncbi:MAG TPA: TIGR01777 family oxidoreductase [Abditibacteriaceae bacterium]|jgi:hypothetical protein